MVKNVNILIVAFALALFGCGSKTNEAKQEAVKPVAQVKTLTLEQKREKLEKDRIARANKLRAEREDLAKKTPTYTDSKGNLVYYQAESQPMYTGGQKALAKYLNDNLKFPDAARQIGAEGTVFVDFVVEKTGQVRSVEVTDDYNADIDQSFRDEAYRVISAMPPWRPGSQHGKRVDVKYNLPITFRLD